MNTAVNHKLAHESESQRQFARVRIPAHLIFELAGVRKRVPVLDLSAGGFAFEWTGAMPVEKKLIGQLEFAIDGFRFTMPVAFDARYESGGRVGCIFQSMDAQQVSALRHVITAFLAGELISMGDMLNILGRENFAKSRSQKTAQGLVGFAKFKALVGSLLFLFIGLLAFVYIVFRLWHMAFVGQALAAAVVHDAFLVKNPRESVVDFLVVPGDSVKSGQIIGTFSSPLVSFLGEALPEAQMESLAVQQQVNKSYVGSLISPCDCVVSELLVAPKAYVGKDVEVLKLVDQSIEPYILAEFTSGEASYLHENKRVYIEHAAGRIQGEIQSFDAVSSSSGLPSVVRARIALTGVSGELKPGTPILVSYDKWSFTGSL